MVLQVEPVSVSVSTALSVIPLVNDDIAIDVDSEEDHDRSNDQSN